MGVDREGPRLAGVFGQKAGSVAGFNYSARLKKLVRGTGASLQAPHRAGLFPFRAIYEVDEAALATAFPSSRLSAALQSQDPA
jgi:hypothetical protein